MFIYNIDIYILYHTQLQIISDGWEHAVVIKISDFYYLNLFYVFFCMEIYKKTQSKVLKRINPKGKN